MGGYSRNDTRFGQVMPLITPTLTTFVMRRAGSAPDSRRVHGHRAGRPSKPTRSLDSQWIPFRATERRAGPRPAWRALRPITCRHPSVWQVVREACLRAAEGGLFRRRLSRCAAISAVFRALSRFSKVDHSGQRRCPWQRRRMRHRRSSHSRPPASRMRGGRPRRHDLTVSPLRRPCLIARSRDEEVANGHPLPSMTSVPSAKPR